MKKKIYIFIALIMIIALFLPPASTNIYGLGAGDFIITPPPKIDVLQFASRHEVIKSVPVYRGVRTGDPEVAGGTFLYTLNKQQFDDWISTGNLADDGIAGYISPVPLPYTTDLYDMFLHQIEEYFAPSEESRDDAILNYGYENYGTMGYVVPLDDNNHGNAKMYQWYKSTTKNHYMWNASNYYDSDVQYLDNRVYRYDGAKFRCWSEEAILQEINVTYPAGGESLSGKSKINISWSTLFPDGSISLYYSLDKGKTWGKIAEGLSNTGSYPWEVPNINTSDAVVEARWIYNGIDANCFDQSDKVFSIKENTLIISTIKPVLSLIAPELIIPPAEPTNLNANSSILQSQPVLYWKDNSFNETGFVIERKIKDGSYEILKTLSANLTKYVDSTAKADTTYYYRVKAVNNKISSKYSNEVSSSVFSLAKAAAPLLTVSDGKVEMYFYVGKNKYTSNGKEIEMDVSPLIIENRTLLPIRYVADPLGADVLWNNDEKKVTINKGELKLELWIGNNTAKINGVDVLIDKNNKEVKPLIINNRTMLPVRFVTEALGCNVDYYAPEGKITINYPKN